MKIQMIIVGLFLSFSSIAGGGWTKPKNKGYFKIGEWWITANRHYDNLGTLDANATTVLANTFLYGEYGMTDRVTATLYFPFFSHAHINHQVSGTNGRVLQRGTQLRSIGDADLSFKYRIDRSNSPYAFAAGITLGLPVGNPAGGDGKILQTGDGEFNQMIRFDLSRSFTIDDKFSGYGTVYSAFNNRSKGFSDEFRAGGELGASYKSKVWLIGRLDIVESFYNGRATFASANNDGATVFANNTEFHSYTIELSAYLTEKIGISTSYGGAFKGKLILANPSHSVGVFFDLK